VSAKKKKKITEEDFSFSTKKIKNEKIGRGIMNTSEGGGNNENMICVFFFFPPWHL